MEQWPTTAVTRAGNVPLYVQLREAIREQIATGVLQPGDRVPSERKLCDLYGVSYITARQSLVDLTNDGLLHRVPGKGTYVGDRRQIQTSLSRPLGIVLHRLGNLKSKAFVSDLIQGVHTVSDEEGYAVSIFIEDSIAYLRDAMEDKLDGLVVAGIGVKNWRILKKAGIPFVLLADWDEQDVYTVSVDMANIAYLQTSHLFDSGCRRIGVIDAPAEEPFVQFRQKGYRRALLEHQVPFDEAIVTYGDYSMADARQKTQSLIEAGVDGIICVDDVVAMGASVTAQVKGLRVPEDITVIGCNNLPFTANMSPSLSTIDLSPAAIGRKAARKLIRLVRKEPTDLTTFVETKLIERESSRIG